MYCVAETSTKVNVPTSELTLPASLFLLSHFSPLLSINLITIAFIGKTDVYMSQACFVCFV